MALIDGLTTSVQFEVLLSTRKISIDKDFIVRLKFNGAFGLPPNRASVKLDASLPFCDSHQRRFHASCAAFGSSGGFFSAIDLAGA